MHTNDKSLSDQVKKFLVAYGKNPAAANWSGTDSLFALFFGINDVVNSYLDGDSTRIDAEIRRYAVLLEKVNHQPFRSE
jgi:hypothetical protein